MVGFNVFLRWLARKNYANRLGGGSKGRKTEFFGAAVLQGGVYMTS